jgi:uncharacterized protein (TIGR02302 family)
MGRGKPPAGGSPGRRALSLARLALFWERLWLAAWPLLGIVGIAVALALFGLPQRLPWQLHLALLVFFALALLWRLWLLLRGLNLPALSAAQRRLERDNRLDHRPLSTLEDEIAVGAGDPFAEALWEAHRARLRRMLGRVHVGLPHPGLARRDPLALRLGLILLLALGAIEAGDDAAARLGAAFTPPFGPVVPRLPVALQLWLTPPAYTNLPPIYLHAEEASAKAPGSEAAPKPVAVPVGSRLLARLQGGSGTPELVLGERRVPFAAVDATTFQLDGAISPAASIAVEQDGRPIADWAMSLVPDQPPTVAFATPPSGTLRGALRIDYDARDDYGVASVKVEIRRKGGPAGEPPLLVDLPLAGGHPRAARETSFHDLTAELWAGLPVVVRLIATDEPGQIGRSAPVEMILPERSFQNPVAREIAAARKLLIANPLARMEVVDDLSAIAVRPSRFGSDPAVFLSLITARSRLLMDRSDAPLPSVEQQLWETALSVEEGHLSAAERELRALQDKLRDALSHNAPDKEIEDLMQQLEAAIDRYVAAMTAPEAGKQQQQEQTSPDSETQQIQSEDLHRMVERAREMARNGARDAARQMLSQLQDMLENLRNAKQGQGEQGKGQASALMRDLDKVIQKQNELLQRSFHASNKPDGQNNGQPAPPSPSMSGPSAPGGNGGDASDQDSARHQLGEIMRRLDEMSGGIPQALGDAEQAMRRAVEALQHNTPEDAVDPQSQALSQLRAGRQGMMQSLKKQLGEEGQEDSSDSFGPGRDPMGRVMPGVGKLDGNDVRIPDHGELQRARQIQDELQRRAGQRTRPEIELDYIDRLLKRF